MYGTMNMKQVKGFNICDKLVDSFTNKNITLSFITWEHYFFLSTVLFHALFMHTPIRFNLLAPEFYI